MNKKFDKLTPKLQEIDGKVSETTKLAEDNKRQVGYLVQEKDSLRKKSKDQIDRNNRSALVIREIKHKNTKRSRNGTESVLTVQTLSAVTLAGTRIILSITLTESIEESMKILIHQYISSLCHGKLPKM